MTCSVINALMAALAKKRLLKEKQAQLKSMRSRIPKTLQRLLGLLGPPRTREQTDAVKLGKPKINVKLFSHKSNCTGRCQWVLNN